MADYTPTVDDAEFLLNEVFDLPSQWAANVTLSQRIDGDTMTAMLNECSKLSSEMIAPLSRNGDEQSCQFDNGAVTTPDGFKQAYQAYSEGGWGGLTGNPEFGALGLPKALAVHCEEMFNAADISFSLYPMLTAGACLTLELHASDDIKQRFLPQMYSGQWSGSMCLTESHAGSDLGIIRTKAIPLETNKDIYTISGSKIFITGGEQDLSDNIIHLVLAKLPDAPAGARGISLFLVPRELENGQRNTVTCGSIEHKMGIKASASCVMNFDAAEGYLIGNAHKGLQAMFTMMNYERVGVGIQGIGAAERSYQCAAQYARERQQGRSSASTLSANQAQSLLVHADVRRMLLTMRAFTEAGRCLSTYVANQLDIAKYGDSDDKSDAETRVALLTPLVKAFCTDRGFESCVLGQQVLGGHGYIREWGQEQLVRDVRITQIYEGTNGIQAMDLLGRKVMPTAGANIRIVADEIMAFMDEHKTALPASMATALTASVESLLRVTEHLCAMDDSDNIGAAAVYYQDLLGYVFYGYMWAKMVVAATGDSQLHRNKRQLAGFYFNHLLPRVAGLQQSLMADLTSMMLIDEADF